MDLRKPTTALVTTGPYRLSRNPGYLSLALIAGGVAVAAASLWTAAWLLVVLVVVDRAVIRREERYLEERFGDAYRRYRSATRRWG